MSPRELVKMWVPISTGPGREGPKNVPLIGSQVMADTAGLPQTTL